MPLCRERCYLEDRNIRLATVLYCLAMVLNTSSSLTNAIASIGLSLDTYLNNMLAVPPTVQRASSFRTARR